LVISIECYDARNNEYIKKKDNNTFVHYIFLPLCSVTFGSSASLLSPHASGTDVVHSCSTLFSSSSSSVLSSIDGFDTASENSI
jgi:hypothetical protein